MLCVTTLSVFLPSLFNSSFDCAAIVAASASSDASVKSSFTMCPPHVVQAFRPALGKTQRSALHKSAAYPYQQPPPGVTTSAAREREVMSMIVYASRFQLEICAIHYTLVWSFITPSGNMYDTFARS